MQVALNMEEVPIANGGGIVIRHSELYRLPLLWRKSQLQTEMALSSTENKDSGLSYEL